MKIIVLFLILLSAQFMNQTQTSSKLTWEARTYKVFGTCSFEMTDNGLQLNFHEDFTTSNGPDLKLVLSKVPLHKIANRDDVTQDGLVIARLRSNKGAQSYALPDSINMRQYKSLLIHCEAYSVVWGGVSLPDHLMEE